MESLSSVLRPVWNERVEGWMGHYCKDALRLKPWSWAGQGQTDSSAPLGW